MHRRSSVPPTGLLELGPDAAWGMQTPPMLSPMLETRKRTAVERVRRMSSARRRYWALGALGAVVLLEWTMCASPAPPPPAPPPPPPPPAPPPPPCPAEMAEIPGANGTFCIDRYEAALVREGPGKQRTPWPGNEPVDGSESEVAAVSRAGQKPQGYISGEQAARACQNAGKRLCAPSEWQTACRGPEHTRYPYGNTRRANVCNDRFDKPTGHPVTRLFKQTKARGDKPAKMWSPAFMNDPRLHELSDTVTPTGSFEQCTNGYGVFDMVGNLHEWVADPKGTFMGGFFMDTRLNGEGCDYRTTAHHFGYHDYSTGFRCCADARDRAGHETDHFATSSTPPGISSPPTRVAVPAAM